MRVFPFRQVAVAAILACSLLGCSSTAKTAKNSAIGSSLAGTKTDDKSLRTAVDKDPFPKAPSAMAAAKPGTSGQ